MVLLKHYLGIVYVILKKKFQCSTIHHLLLSVITSVYYFIKNNLESLITDNFPVNRIKPIIVVILCTNMKIFTIYFFSLFLLRFTVNIRFWLHNNYLIVRVYYYHLFEKS